jgi:DNA mismatch repair protein MutS2
LSAVVLSDSINELAPKLKIEASKFSKEKFQDLIERVKLGDIDGISSITKITKIQAQQMVKAFYDETYSGQTVRKMLRTPDAKRLAKDVLAIFSRQASSSIGRDSLSLLDLKPMPPRDILRQNMEGWLLGMKALAEVDSRLRKLENLLAGVELIHGSAGALSFNSDTIDYFLSRRKALETFLTVSKEFADSNSISTLLNEVDQSKIKEVVRLLDGLAKLEIPDAYAIISDAELAINEKFRKGGRKDQYAAKSVIENQLGEIAATLRMNLEEENKLMKAVMENLSVPVELSSRSVRAVIEAWRARLSSEFEGKVSKIEGELKKHWGSVSLAIEKIVKLDQIFAVAKVMKKYSLSVPVVGTGGIGFVKGRNFLLSEEELIVPIDYCVGKTVSLKVVAPARNVVMLTGANSGGKTTLLTTVAAIHVLSLLGLPVPAESAEVNPAPIYLFRKRTTKRVGSLEHALRSLIPVFAERQTKLVLMDEFEALTEPGAAGRIVASIINHVATGSSSVLLVTHLAAEILPHVKLPIRVDGIEATGIDDKGDLIVERQPKFNHIGSSTPQHIIGKLSRNNLGGRGRNAKQIASLYNEILESLSEETERGVQAPLSFPWISGEN